MLTVIISHSFSLSLSLTHTHTHTHIQLLRRGRKSIRRAERTCVEEATPEDMPQQPVRVAELVNERAVHLEVDAYNGLARPCHEVLHHATVVSLKRSCTRVTRESCEWQSALNEETRLLQAYDNVRVRTVCLLLSVVSLHVQI